MIWRILTRAWLIYFAGAFEVFSASVFAFIVIAFYGEVIPTGSLERDGDVYIYVRSNGIHTELCLPTEQAQIDWKAFVPVEDFGDSISRDFIVFGWGDKGFYMNTPTWEDLTAKTAVNAIALPTPTAMHVAYEQRPEEGKRCIKVPLSQEQYKKIVAYVRESFHVENKRVQLISGKGYGPNDNFYEARRSYHLFRTCNTWTNNALKEADVRTALLAVFPNGVMGHLRN